MTKLVHVAVGVIFDGSGNILIAKRPDSAHQGGLWEFPGGKVDAGENIHQALVRELKEELAIKVTASEPLIQIRHHYVDKSVLLDVQKVMSFEGEPTGNEGQPIRWVTREALSSYEFPAANRPIITAIRLPQQYAITGEFSSLAHFTARLENALQQGARLIQLRVAKLSVAEHADILQTACALCAANCATLMINTSTTEFALIRNVLPQYPCGLHLNRHELFAQTRRPVAPEILLGASCHNSEEITQAQKIGVDYVLLSPVLKTDSHPDSAPLGWKNFADLVEQVNVPVYALGGMQVNDLAAAIHSGAQGIAGISRWWK